MVVFRFDRKRIRAIALDLIPQRADHLAVAGVATFTNINVSTCEFERRVDTHVGRVLDCIVDREQGSDLDEAADAGNNNNGENEADGAAFDFAMKFGHVFNSAGAAAPSATSRV